MRFSRDSARDFLDEISGDFRSKTGGFSIIDGAVCKFQCRKMREHTVAAAEGRRHRVFGRQKAARSFFGTEIVAQYRPSLQFVDFLNENLHGDFRSNSPENLV